MVTPEHCSADKAINAWKCHFQVAPDQFGRLKISSKPSIMASEFIDLAGFAKTKGIHSKHWRSW